MNFIYNQTLFKMYKKELGKNNAYCSNCGKIGHHYKRCLEPIISLGIVIFKKTPHSLKYLIIQRKDTLGFVEFMRGKYNIENIKYIRQLFDIMTEKEKDEVASNNFDYLWDKLWLKNNKHFHNEYINSKNKFNKLKRGFSEKQRFINLSIIRQESSILYTEPEWGFPKGRRNIREKDLDCAMREFMEETGIKEGTYRLLDINPVSESFIGTNNIRYKHIYYVAEANDSIPDKLTVDIDNINQVSEISNIEWVTFVEGLKRIRTYNIEKKNMLEQLNSFLVGNTLTI